MDRKHFDSQTTWLPASSNRIPFHHIHFLFLLSHRKESPFEASRTFSNWGWHFAKSGIANWEVTKSRFDLIWFNLPPNDKNQPFHIWSCLEVQSTMDPKFWPSLGWPYCRRPRYFIGRFPFKHSTISGISFNSWSETPTPHSILFWEIHFQSRQHLKTP